MINNLTAYYNVLLVVIVECTPPSEKQVASALDICISWPRGDVTLNECCVREGTLSDHHTRAKDLRVHVSEFVPILEWQCLQKKRWSGRHPDTGAVGLVCMAEWDVLAREKGFTSSGHLSSVLQSPTNWPRLTQESEQPHCLKVG